MEKITFLIPPALHNNRIPERVFGCTFSIYPIPNIFLLGYAAVLKKAGYDVSVMDAPVMGMKTVEFYGWLADDISNIYVFYSVNLSKEIDKEVFQQIRTFRGSLPVIFCGPAPTTDPEFFLFDTGCFVARGEGDLTIPELIDFITDKSVKNLNDIQGINYLNTVNKSVRNPGRELIENLDDLPFPAREMIHKELYYNPKLKERPFTTVLTSRGCPFQCTYCVPSSLSFAVKLEYNIGRGTTNGIPKVRFRSPKIVIEEFTRLQSEGYKTVSIIDDDFVLNAERTIEICAGIKSLGIKWGCLARADSLLDDSLIKAMADSGCIYIDIGIESFNQDILDDIKKGIKLETFYEAIKLLKKHGIQSKLNILLAASPLETKGTMMETIRESIRLEPAMVMFSICNPFPGTEFYNRAKKEGWMVYGDYVPVDLQKKAIIEYPHLKKRVIEKMVKKANFDFFLSPRFILKNIFRFKNPIDFLLAFKSLTKKLTGW